MSEPREHSDEELIALLQQGLIESDPVPSDVIGFAKAALGWRQIDADLAQVSFDSELEAPAAVRSAATARMLTFEAGEWAVDIEYDPAVRTLLGQTTPAGAVSVELHTSGDVAIAQSDGSGRFSFEGVSPGPVSIVVRTGDGSVAIKTEWTVL